MEFKNSTIRNEIFKNVQCSCRTIKKIKRETPIKFVRNNLNIYLVHKIHEPSDLFLVSVIIGLLFTFFGGKLMSLLW